jgi:hypothetical protein
MQYKHRAGVLEYPSPQKPAPIVSPSRLRVLAAEREAKKREEYIQAVRDRWSSPVAVGGSPIKCSGTADFDDENESQPDDSLAVSRRLEEELTHERQRNDDLEEKVNSLTRVTRKLVGAIKKSSGILQSSIDNPETQAILDA